MSSDTARAGKDGQPEPTAKGESEVPAHGRGISVRSIIIGLILSILHTFWIVYEETALGHLSASFTAMMLVPSVIGILFFIMVLNSLFRRTIPSWVLSPSEMMVIFVMTTISSVISGFDLLQNLFPVLMWPFFLGAPTAGYNKYFQYIPSWFVPQDKTAIKDFFMGSQDFWHFFSPQIFSKWVGPMIFWAVFLFTLAFTMYCLNSILRRQWVDREKLTFPIIELPIMMARQNTAGSMLKNPLFLCGFTVTAALLSINFLSGLYPSIPTIRMSITNIGSMLFTTPPATGMNPIWVTWQPFAIGLCYLMPVDVSFSSWFFYVFIRLAELFATAVGWREPYAGFNGDQFPFINNLAQGAWIGMFVVVMWAAKSHIVQIVRSALRGEKLPGEEKEPMSYRAALLGAAIGFIALVAAITVSGVRLQYALLFFTLYFLAVIVMTRIYAQVAVPSFELSFYNSITLMTGAVGTKAFTPQELTVLTNFHWIDRTYRQHVMGHEIESMAFAEKQGQSMRRMSMVVIVALVTGIIVGMFTLLQIYYNRGASTAHVTGWQVGVGGEAWGRHLSWVQNQRPFQWTTLLKIGSSTAIVLALAAARNCWFGFPLHPIGYAFACSYSMEYIWNIVLITWLIKILVIRYGGLNLYRKSLPLFFGLVVGDAVTQFVWSVTLSLMGVRGGNAYGPNMW